MIATPTPKVDLSGAGAGAIFSAEDQVDGFDFLPSAKGEKVTTVKDHPERAAAMLPRIKEFGKLQKSGATPSSQAREGFVAPRDWRITK